jgi:hypothetical protein
MRIRLSQNPGTESESRSDGVGIGLVSQSLTEKGPACHRRNRKTQPPAQNTSVNHSRGDAVHRSRYIIALEPGTAESDSHSPFTAILMAKIGLGSLGRRHDAKAHLPGRRSAGNSHHQSRCDKNTHDKSRQVRRFHEHKYTPQIPTIRSNSSMSVASSTVSARRFSSVSRSSPRDRAFPLGRQPRDSSQDRRKAGSSNTP